MHFATESAKLVISSEYALDFLINTLNYFIMLGIFDGKRLELLAE